MTKEILPLNVNNNANNNSSSSSSPNNAMKSNRPKFYCPENTLDEEIDEDVNKIIEESPNGRWSKLEQEIFVQKLIDFDSTNLAIDTEKGVEIAWNEMKFVKSSRSYLNRFDDQATLENIYENLNKILNFLIKLEHPNLLKFYDFWFVNNQEEAKLVVITEYSSAGCLKKLLDGSRMSQTKIKPQTYKRWLNQIIYTIKCLHNDQISIFQGHLSSESIFIQNSGVIKLSPTLLSLNGLCEVWNNLIKCSNNNKKPNIELTNEIILKDLHAIGRLALEIFNAHLKQNIQSPTSPLPVANKNNHRFSIFNILNHIDSIEESCLFRSLNYLESELQKEFVLKCFQAGDSNFYEQVNIESIWFHPFINNVHSLKVLSVYSILNYFQDKKCNSSTNNNNNNNNININTNNNNNSNNNTNNNNKRKLSNNIKELCANNQNENQTVHKSNSSSSLTKSNSLNQLKLNNLNNDKRKVSLTFLTQYNNLKIPQDFFGILEDIRSGLYPRLFKSNKTNSSDSSSPFRLRSISSSSCLDFVLQQKQILDRRSSFNLSSNYNPNDDSILMLEQLTNKSNSENNDLNDLTNITSTSTSNSLSIIKYPIEQRRIISEICLIKNSNQDSMTELCLNLTFNDSLSRSITSYFPYDLFNYIKQENETLMLMNNSASMPTTPNNSFIYNDFLFFNLVENNKFELKLENISHHLANELIDQGLINPKDHNLIAESFFKAIKEYVSIT